MLTREVVAVTTAADGSATGYTAPVTGFVRAIRYVPHASTPLDTGADITITGDGSGIAILTLLNLGTAAISILPRAATTLVSNTANAAEVYAGTDSVNDVIPVCEERIKVVVANGADTKSGTFHIYIG